MEDHLQKIRDKHPDLNPTETYELLKEAIMPDVMEENVDFEAIKNALEQYEALLDIQITNFQNSPNPESAKDLLEDQFKRWFENMKMDHHPMQDMFWEIKDIMMDVPDKSKLEEIVDGKIQKDYPEFHKEYLEHQQWLKANEERLERQEQRQQQGEPEQPHSRDSHIR